MANQGDYTHFIFVSDKNQSFGFRTYNNEFGQAVGFLVGKNPDGTPIYERWKWDQDGKRSIPVHKNKTDLNGVRAVDFLRKSPNCHGSPLTAKDHSGNELNIMIKELDQEADAKISLDAEIEKINAANLALKVTGQEFIDLCALIGVFGDADRETAMRFALFEFAKRKPLEFMSLYNDKVRQLKSLLRRGVENGVIQKQGRMLSWEDQLLGVDEESAVIKLSADEKLTGAIKKHIDTKK